MRVYDVFARAAALALALVLLPAALAGPAAAATPSSAAPAPKLAPADCAGKLAARFVCGILPVPLDHRGGTAGQLGLRVSLQRDETGGTPLVVLTGGPGQPGAEIAPLVGKLLRWPAGNRIVTLDQRGTGPGGALTCAALQRVSRLAATKATCAEQLGARRAFFSTRDTVEDLELLRRTLGARQIVVMGTSYGSFVAERYARIHPATTARLVLDSPVPAAGVDPFGVSSFAAIRRILRDLCRGRACRGIARNPLADLRRVLARADRGRLRGAYYDRRGRRHRVALRDRRAILGVLQGMDFDPWTRASLPGALAAAARGDSAPLLRLLDVVYSAPGAGPAHEFSLGLNATTTCLDTRLPYGLDQPLPAREQAAAAALAAIPSGRLAPFSRRDAFGGSLADACTAWPGDRVAAPSTGPLPRVPVLVLSGSDDVRTPLEDARTTAAAAGRALLQVQGVGHSVLTSDASSCTSGRVADFLRGGSVASGRCDSAVNRIVPRAIAPLRIAQAGGKIGGVPREVARVIGAVLWTTDDAINGDALRRSNGAGTRGGGLRGGRYRSTRRSITLARYVAIPGVRVSGQFTSSRSGVTGRLRVDGPGRLDGTLRISPRRIDGRIGRTAVRLVAR